MTAYFGSNASSYFTLAGAVCGFVPFYLAKKHQMQEVGPIRMFVCALAGYASGLAAMLVIPPF